MFDPLLTLIAAKTKAVGLIAGTAMVTTALVGGGAVAMTAVSSDSAVEESVVEEVVVETETADLEAVQTATSDTPTVGIEDDDEDESTDGEKVRPPLPADFTCDDSVNHGQNVSAYAKSLPKGPGRGAKVSAVAQSDCGKKAKDDATEVEEADEAETEADEAETEADESDEVEEPKPAKAEKPAKAPKAPKAANSKGGGKK